MKRRLFFLLRFYVTTVLLFIAAKWVFMFCDGGGHEVQWADYPAVAWHGLSLDLSTSLYLLIVPFLLTILSVWMLLPRWMYYIYNGVVAVVLALAFVADTSLYPFWLFKLDASCLAYLETPTEAMASVSTGYIVLRLLLVVLVAAVVYGAYRAGGDNGSYRPNKLPWRIAETLFYVLLIPLIIIGIRGGLAESTTNIGQVYYSQNQFLNHAAVNPVFSFMASMEETASDIVEYDYMSDEECRQLTDGLFPTTTIGADTLLTTQRPNIVVILVESMGGIFTEIGGRTDIMPRFNQLCREGIYFSRCYANSWRTDRGTLCTWSGYPSFPTMSVMKMPAKTRHLPSIASTLQSEGYKTTYLYGGDINFTNMRSYLVGTGFERLVWKNDYSREEQNTSEWGVRDDITFDTLRRLLNDGGQPQLIGFSTLSSHQPWDVPLHHFGEPELNAFYYVDQCIGRFIDDMKKSVVWKDLLIVILPDHGINYADVGNEHPLHNHIPMLWIGGAVKKSMVFDKPCNQTDLPAMLLGQMGIDHSHFPYSRDVFSRSYTRPFAYHTYRNGYSLVDSTCFMVYDLDSNRRTVGEGADADRLERLGKALLQLTSKDLKDL